jgi:hypothetical protein
MGNLMDELDFIYICDECDTLAIVTQEGNTITITPCECQSN